MSEQIDGFENEDGFILRLYSDFSIWVYWPVTLGKVEFHLSTAEEARTLFEALKPIIDKRSKEDV